MKGIIEDNPNSWSKEPPTLQDLRAALEIVAQEGKGWERNSTKEILAKNWSSDRTPVILASQDEYPA